MIFSRVAKFIIRQLAVALTKIIGLIHDDYDRTFICLFYSDRWVVFQLLHTQLFRLRKVLASWCMSFRQASSCMDQCGSVWIVFVKFLTPQIGLRLTCFIYYWVKLYTLYKIVFWETDTSEYLRVPTRNFCGTVLE